MTRPRIGRWHLVIAGVVVVAIALASVVWIGSRGSRDDEPAATVPPAEVELAPPPSGMVVALERLGAGNSAVPEGTHVPLVVSAGAQDRLSAVELWANDTLLDRRNVAEPPATATRLAFDWAATPGDVVLTARAVDAAGRTAISNGIRLRVGGAPRLSTIVEHTTVAGDTIESIAAEYGTSPQLLTLANPGTFQPGPLATGTNVQVPVEVPFAEDGQPAGGPARRPSGAPPPVAITLDGCTATATVAAPADITAVDGVAAYLLPPGGETFELLASVAVTDTLTFPVPGGTSLVVVGAFAGGVPTLGPPQLVTPNEPCAEGWTGDVRLAGTRLVTAAGAIPDVEVAYLYASNGGPWERLPATGFVARDADGFDFAGLVPDLSQGRLDVDAWGRSGGALVPLGKGSYRATEKALPPSTQHLRTQLWWVKNPNPEELVTKGFVPNPGVLRFRWKASSPLVTKVAWQVTSYLPPSTAGLDIPGVIAQGTVPGNQTLFDIDFAKFTGKKTVPTASASAALGPMAQIGGPVTGPFVGGAVDNPVVVSADGPLLGGNAPAAVDDPVLSVVPQPSRFYVRLLAFIGDQFSGRASLPVVIDTKFDPSALGEIDLTPGPNVYDLDIAVKAPIPGIPWYSKCWRITGMDPSKFDPAQSFQYKGWQTFVAKVGNVVCPICYVAGNWQWDYAGLYGWHCAEDDGFDLGDPGTWDEFPILGPLVSKLVEVGTSAWDFVVELAMYLKAKVVDLVAEVGCTGFVKGAGVDPQKAESWCHDLAEIAVDAVLISFGIPPTLPTFEQLVQAAKGQLADVIVELATDLGVPCDEAALAGEIVSDTTLTCEALAKELIDQIVETAKAAVSASASAVSGIYFPPGVYAVPHEAGQVTPGSVTVTVMPTSESPASGWTCPATVTMAAAFTAPDHAFGQSKFPELNIGYWYNYGAGNGMWVPSGPYGGALIEPTTVPLPKLVQVGGQLVPASATYPLLQMASHDPVQGHSYVGQTGNWPAVHPLVPYESVQLHPGAMFTASVHASCAIDTTVTGFLTGGGNVGVTKVTG